MPFSFAWIAVSFAAGIFFSRFASLPYSWILLSFFLPALWFLRRHLLFGAALCATFFILGTIFFHSHDDLLQTPLKVWAEINSENPRLGLQGTVLSEPEIKTHGRKRTVSFSLKVNRLIVRKKDGRFGGYPTEDKIQIFVHQGALVPETGDRILLWGHLRSPEPLKNPGGFDYYQYLKDRGISFTFNAYGAKSLKILEPGNSFHIFRLIAKLRRKIRARIENLFSHQDGLMIRALILGDRKEIPEKWYDDFLKTGTSHLIAISGLNIAMAAGSFYFVLILMGIPQRAAAAVALLLSLLQVGIAGSGIPVQRAGIMAALGFLAFILEREKNGLNLLALAFLILLIIHPRNLFSVSFQLSFLSVLALMIFSHLWKWRGHWSEGLASSAAVLVGTFPVVLHHFSTFSPMSILANLLAIPLFHLVLLTGILSLCLGNIPLLGSGFLVLCHFWLKLAMAWIHFCAKPDWGYFFFPKPEPFAFILYYVSLSALLWTAGTKRKILAGLSLAGFIAALFLMTVPKKDSGFSLTFLSAGSNEIAHIYFERNNQWLINAGRTFPGNQTEWIVEPYLRSQGIKNLTGILFIDHRKRHTAGLDSLNGNFKIGYEVFPALRKNSDLAFSKKIFLHKGNKIRTAGAEIKIVDHFQEKFSFVLSKNENSILFIPEISVHVLKNIKEEKIKADILAVPVVKQEHLPLLKGILTLTQAEIVISPRSITLSESHRSQPKIHWINLESEGAVKIMPQNTKWEVQRLFS